MFYIHMSKIKTLRRVPRHSPVPNISQPQIFDTRWDAIKSHLPSITFGMRKTADGEPATAVERIREFFALNFPSINATEISSVAQKLKMPLLAVVGVAAAAGLAYLVYKVWTNRSSIHEAINKFIEDIKSVAPNLTNIPGWLESIKNEVTDAFNKDNPSTTLEKLVKIKESIISHEHSINGKVGSGINLFDDITNVHRTHNGSGIKVVKYR